MGRRVQPQQPVHYESVELMTEDGYALRLYRSPASVSSLGPRSRPVLLLHGANANRFTFGVVPDLTLAATLNATGRDVWLLEFRGCRSSAYRGADRPVLDLDRKIDHDLPAAISRVLAETGASMLDIVGHSLGGVFAYCYCAKAGQNRVGRVVTVASPDSFASFFGAVSPLMHYPTKWLAPVAQRMAKLGIARAAQLPGPLPHLAAMRNHLQPRSMRRSERRAWLSHGVEDMYGDELAQLMLWITAGRFVTADGLSCGRTLETVSTPTLVIRSDKDGLVPGAAVTSAYRRLGSADKAYRVIGRRHGATRDYGHADLLLARSAVYDVHPHIVDWLDRPAPERAGADQALSPQASKGARSRARWA